MVNPTISHIVQEFKKALQGLYGDRLRDVVLYGSYARGDYHDESDIDLMVILTDDRVNIIDEVFTISPLISDFIVEYGVLISVLPVGYTKYLTSYMPVYQAARQEGVFL